MRGAFCQPSLSLLERVLPESAAAEPRAVSPKGDGKMAIFGIGATYDKDVSTDFIEQELACVGWDENDAPPAHSILRQLRTGDIIFIKSFAPQVGLTIKAVGLVMEGKVRNNADLGSCVSVKWIWKGEERIGKLNDKWPVRSVTIYEEHHPAVQKKVIELLLGSS
jgi:hypothetical protein